MGVDMIPTSWQSGLCKLWTADQHYKSLTFWNVFCFVREEHTDYREFCCNMVMADLLFCWILFKSLS